MIKFIAIKVSEDNNLMYLFYTEEIAFSVDSTDPDLLMECLSKDFSKEYYLPSEIRDLPNTHNRNLLYSFTTHHHYDHSSGDRRIKKLFPNIIQVKDGDQEINLQVGDQEASIINIKCIKTPCHTKDSICILIDNKYMCTGDTIFFLGCGMFFEGTAGDMLNCIRKIKEYNDNIILLYGHNYKDRNLKFIRSECPNINYVEDQRIFLTLKEEKTYNPFFLIDNEEEMGELRDRKNKF